MPNIKPAMCFSLALALLLAVLSAGCRTVQQSEPTPDAVTIAYVGAYRGFHRPCG